MNIGFDAKRYFHNRTGLGNYSRSLVDTLCNTYDRENFFLFDKNPSTINLPANTIAVVPMGNSLFWREVGMLKDVKRFRLDVFHGLSNELPWGSWPDNVRKIVTVHDVIFDIFPEQYPVIDRSIYRKKTAHALKVADTVIATSIATADDIIRHYSVDANKLKVVYQTCGELHWKTYTEKEIEDFRNSRQLKDEFMLYVSSFETRKNHLQLLRSFKQLADKNAKLVLAGRRKETYDNCVAYVKENGLEKQVTFITDISNTELPLLYRSAQSFIYPSMVEGFGIPLVEAACANLPMAVSDIAVFREIAPDGTLFLDIENVSSMAERMRDLMKFSRQDHSSHMKAFTPVYAAERMMEIYKF